MCRAAVADVMGTSSAAVCSSRPVATIAWFCSIGLVQSSSMKTVAVTRIGTETIRPNDAEQPVDGDHADGDCGGVHLDGARDTQGLDDVPLDLVGQDVQCRDEDRLAGRDRQCE